MAVFEIRHLGPIYFAREEANVIRPPIHKVGVVQMHHPWRVGKALVIAYAPFRVAIIGLWWKTPPIAGELDEERWLSPAWLPSTVDEIAGWSDGTEEEEEAGV